LHDETQTAARPVMLALAAGGVTAALLWRAPAGLSWLVFVLAFVLACLCARGGPRGGALAWLWGAGATWLAACVCWRASEWTLAIGVPASATMVMALPLVVHRRLRISELGELPALCVAWAFGARAAAGEARRRLPRLEGSRSRRVLCGIAIGGPIALVATMLLSANPRFVALVGDVLAHTSSAVSFAMWSLGAALVYAVGSLALGCIHCGVLEKLRNAALIGRVAVAAAEPTPSPGSPYRAADGRPTVLVPRTLPALTWVIVLAQLIVVFGLFVVANLGDLFGGHALVRAAGTTTYAEHLHAGFLSVTAATVLAVAVVMFGHRVAAPPDSARATTLSSALEVGLLVLTAITLASCWQRTTIYMEAYGYTHQRLGVVLIQLAVLGLLVLTLARAVLRSWRGYAAAVVALPVVLAIAATTFDADLYVARANLRRLVDAPPTATSSGLDVAYLERLSIDALPALEEPHVPAELADRLAAVWLERAAQHAYGDWRGRRGLGPALARARASSPATRRLTTASARSG
jgi:hypothetical protein